MFFEKMNVTTPPLRVFISGNSSEFKQLRQAASQTVLSRGWVPVAQDHFSTQQGELPDILKELVKSCDAVICLVGTCYGHEPEMSGSRRRSYTQMEYDFAREFGLPVFIFMKPAGTLLQSASPPEAPELAVLQKVFVQEIKASNLLYHTFGSEDELRLRILAISPSYLENRVMPKDNHRRGSGLLWLGVAALVSASIAAAFILREPEQASLPHPKEVPTKVSNPPKQLDATSARQYASADDAHTNSLGMIFLPAGTSASGKRILVSKWETRVRDWMAFAKASGLAYSPPVGTQDLHPASMITLRSMVAFCDWLTAQESAAGRIPAGAAYRLPTLDEWRMAVGMPEGGTGPLYVWEQMPQPGSPALANFSGGETATGNSLLPDDHHIKSSPAGTFPPNKNGFCDLAGNIGEVCAVSGGKPVICGGDWQDMDWERMDLSRYRPYDLTDDVSETVGFRCLLEISD